MTALLGRETEPGPTAPLGVFLARDGSDGAPVALDLEHPHVGLVTGKRGTGKSYTMGVIAEGLATATGVTGVVIDPMGVFGGLAAHPGATVIDAPTIPADSLTPRDWCELLDLDPTGAPGALLWRAAESGSTVPEMLAAVENSQAPAATVQAVHNHLTLAQQWDVFGSDSPVIESLLRAPVTVLDASQYDDRALSALTAAVARTLYRRASRTTLDRLPWLLVDEAQTVTDSVAARPLHTILTRGRHPGVSLVLGTQRPAALPPVAISQADLLLSHRLTSTADIDALAAARPTYLDGSLADRLPDGVGEAVVIDDTTESTVTVTIKQRRTPHGGDSPTASDCSDPTPTTSPDSGGESVAF